MPEASETVLVISVHGTIWLLDAQTGAIRWQYLPNERIASLIHGGDMVYVASYMPLMARASVEIASKHNISPLSPYRPPTAWSGTLAALRTTDGTEAWSKMGWTTPGGSSALDGDMLITDMLGPEIGTTTIEGLDRHTGEHVRTFATSESYSEPVRLFAAASGRILVNDSRGERHLGVYETATGTDLWRRPYQETPPAISADGTLLVYGQEVLRIADGTAHAPVRDHIFHMTPIVDGIAYLTSPGKRSYPPTVRISALRLADSTTLWNTPPIVSGSLQISGDLLLSSDSKYPHKFIEIVARDRRTGELLWRWSTPRHIIALLWLWGRNIPLMIAKAINEARWTLKQRESPGRGRRRRDVLWHEFLHGQGRRPTHLIGPYTVAGSRDTVYVGTSLGLFAVNARTGKLRWHALPTMHIARIVPAPSLK